MKKSDLYTRYLLDSSKPYVLIIWGPVGKKLKEIQLEKNNDDIVLSKINDATRNLGRTWRQATLFDPKTHKRTVVKVNPNYEKERLKEKQKIAGQNNYQKSVSRFVLKNPSLGI